MKELHEETQNYLHLLKVAFKDIFFTVPPTLILSLLIFIHAPQEDTIRQIFMTFEIAIDTLGGGDDLTEHLR